MENRELVIWMVEDNEFFADMVAAVLNEQDGFEIKVFHTGEEMLRKAEAFPHILLLDYQLNSSKLTNLSGKQVLESVKMLSPDTYVVMISSQQNMGTAIELLKKGACNYICKDTLSIKNITQTLFDLKKLIEVKAEADQCKAKVRNERRRLFVVSSFVFIIMALSYYLG